MFGKCEVSLFGQLLSVFSRKNKSASEATSRWRSTEEKLIVRACRCSSETISSKCHSQELPKLFSGNGVLEEKIKGERRALSITMHIKKL